MGKLKVLSGSEVCKILANYGFVEVRQKESYVIMQRKTEDTTITVPVPNHNEILKGTLKSIIRQSSFPSQNLKFSNTAHRIIWWQKLPINFQSFHSSPLANGLEIIS